MNKRIKFKKGVLQKKCSFKCRVYKYIYYFGLTTNNCCLGCMFRTGKAVNSLLEENYQIRKKYKRVSIAAAGRIIESREPRGLFWTAQGGRFVGIDNITGDAWTEDFKTREECFEFLEG